MYSYNRENLVSPVSFSVKVSVRFISIFISSGINISVINLGIFILLYILINVTRKLKSNSRILKFLLYKMVFNFTLEYNFNFYL